ncbi:MAG: hypothetical protein H6518_05455 [Microthrixaceae bacterium]|nr:hypothetical protein [Microthrixaceae bacterium]
MNRLAPIDAAFLYMETPSSHMHVTGVIILDPSTMRGGYSFEAIRDMLASRIHLLPPYRRRLLTVPFHLDDPVFIEDPDFDIANHVHRMAVPPPGRREDLAEIIGDVAGRALDRGKPLWETVVVEGSDDGTVALICKVHHACIDGVTGADLMSQLFDLDPDAPEPPAPAEAWSPDRIPSDLELLADAGRNRLLDPLRGLRGIGRLGATVVPRPPRPSVATATGGPALHGPEDQVHRRAHPAPLGRVRAGRLRRPPRRQEGVRREDQRRGPRRVHTGL